MSETPGRETTTSIHDARVGDYAHRPVLCVEPELPAEEAAALFLRERVSGAPVVGPGQVAVGVVSASDLIALSLFGPTFAHAWAPPDEDAPALPPASRYDPVRVRDIMTPAVWSARPREPLLIAAERLLEARVHRLIVLGRGGRVEGLLSTVDFMRAVRDARLERPIGQIATRETESVEIGTPVSAVMRRLLDAGYTGMPVTDNGWPVGFVSQAELLRARGRSAATPVEEIASPAMLCLPDTTPLWRAAEEALRQSTRRILVCRSRQVTGILTSVDFTRALRGR